MNAAQTTTRPLSQWDAKMHQKRLANERPESRALRLAAENPDATGNELSDLWENARQLWLVGGPKSEAGVVLAMEAVACHPNTPPDVLCDLFPVCARAFCANPIAPLVLLERPDFAHLLSVDSDMAEAVVGQEDAPSALVAAIAANPSRDEEELVRAARLHKGLGGEVQTQAEWERDLSAYWKAFCAQFEPEQESQKALDEHHAHWHNDLAELSLAPAWAGLPPFLWEPTCELSLDGQEWLRFEHVPGSPLARACWARIAPAFQNYPSLAGHLRADATPFDLIALLHTPGSEKGILHEVIAAHAHATAAVLLVLARLKSTRTVRLVMAQSPHAPAALLATFAENDDPLVRRLARRNPNAPADICAVSRRAVLKHIGQNCHPLSKFVHFAGVLFGAGTPCDAALLGQSVGFTVRLSAALTASRAPVAFPHDPARRTSRDLLEHLARDGNRLVRWAAQKRLDEPAWTFSWQDAA